MGQRVELHAVLEVATAPYSRRLSEVDAAVVLEAAFHHFAPLREAQQPDSETVPFLGGVRLLVGDVILLEPQCCGDLSDVLSWFELVAPRFECGIAAPGGHPAAQVKRTRNILQFTCAGADEVFSSATCPEFSVQRGELIEALAPLLQEVKAFCALVDSLHGNRLLSVGARHLVGVEPEVLERALAEAGVPAYAQRGRCN